MNIELLMHEADKLYKRKLATGLYNDYTPELLDQLYIDCLNQCKMMFPS